MKTLTDKFKGIRNVSIIINIP